MFLLYRDDLVVALANLIAAGVLTAPAALAIGVEGMALWVLLALVGSVTFMVSLALAARQNERAARAAVSDELRHYPDSLSRRGAVVSLNDVERYVALHPRYDSSRRRHSA